MMEEKNIFNRLYEQETTPPPGMWNRIAQKLDEETEASSTTPVVEMTRNLKTNWLKIALAASFIGFATMSVLWILEKNQKYAASSSSSEIAKTKNIPADTINLNTINTNQGSQKNVAEAATITTSKQLETATTSIKTASIVKNNTPKKIGSKEFSIIDNSKEVYLSQAPKNTVREIVSVQPATITIKDVNGNPIRNIEYVKSSDASTVAGPDSKGDKAIGSILSKISLSNDKEEIDNIINNSAYWKKQIQDWRKKLIKSGYAPSIVNNLDILELIKLLDEK